MCASSAHVHILYPHLYSWIIKNKNHNGTKSYNGDTCAEIICDTFLASCRDLLYHLCDVGDLGDVRK